MEYRKAIQYSDFIKLAPEVRREHANFFLKNYPEYCPVALNVEHGGKPVPLRMCKFLIRKNTKLSEEQEIMRSFIIKHSQDTLTSKDQVTFWHQRKLIDQSLLVRDFQQRCFKDPDNDGWVHLHVTTQETLG